MDHLLSDRNEQSKLIAPEIPKESKTPEIISNSKHKNVKKKKLTPSELREFALAEIHKFYSRQHQKKENGFDDLDKRYRMEKGEFIIFCKDFDLRLPLPKYLEIFRSVSQ